MSHRGRLMLPIVVLAAFPLAGCGGDATPGPSAQPSSLAPARSLNSPLPTGWPAEVRLPSGAHVFDAKADEGRLSVGFDSQQQANDVAAFLEAQIKDAGFRELSRKSSTTGLSVNYTGGTRSASFQLTDEGGTTEVVMLITLPNRSRSGLPTTSASPSTSPTP